MKYTLVFAFLGLTTSAMAGFEFVPTQGGSSVSTAPINRAVPVAPVSRSAFPIAPAATLQPIQPPQNLGVQYHNVNRPQPIVEGVARSATQQNSVSGFQRPSQPMATPSDILTPTTLVPSSQSASVDFAPIEARPSRVMPMTSPQGSIPTQSLAVYSEVGVAGASGGSAFVAQRPEKKRSSRFAINPFPFGKEKKPSEQHGVLFGQPVSSAPKQQQKARASRPANLTPASTTAAYKWQPSPMHNKQHMAPTSLTKKTVTSSTPVGTLNQQAAFQGQSAMPNAVGFGKDIPLSIALSQIVPNDYSFSYGDGVNMSQNVSWEGGRPWDQVLQAVLVQKGMVASISGKSVHIMKSSQISHVMNEWSVQDVYGAGMIFAEPQISDNTLAQDVAYDDEIRLWTAPRSASLRSILESWSKEAGVQMYWRATYDYPVQSDVNIQGTFQEAVELLLDGLREAEPRPVARLHPNLPDGPAVLIVQTRHIIR